MSAPTLFDAEISHVGLTRLVRSTDPVTSHLAAKAVAPGCKDCIDAIRAVVTTYAMALGEPVDAFQIAEGVERLNPRRWDEGTIRRRVKDAGLTKVDRRGESPRGSACDRFTL